MAKARGPRIITPNAVLSYPNLVTATAMEEGEKEKFSTAVLFHEDTDVKPLKKALLDVAAEAFGGVAKAKAGIKNGTIKWPFRDGVDVEAKGYVERIGEGGSFFNTRSERKPGVVFAYKDPTTGKAAVVPDDKIEELAYAGCNVRVLVEPYSYEGKKSKGVTFGLAGVQILNADGERIDGRIAAEDAFEVDEDASPADFDDLPGEVEDEDEPETEDEGTEDEDGDDPLDDLT